MTAVDAAAAHAELAPESTRSRTIVWQDPVAAAGAGAGMAGLDYMRAIAAGELPPPPIAVLMRMQPVEVDPGLVVFEGEPGEEHYNPIGTVHGGYAATLLDSVLGCAVHTTLEAGEGYTTAGLEVEVPAPDHPRCRAGSRRRRGALPRPPPGDRPGAAHRCIRGAAARLGDDDLHDPELNLRPAIEADDSLPAGIHGMTEEERCR